MTLGKIGARDMMYRWRNPYVTDGLVAMWDGEWNAGGGVHDASATTWCDLSGNGYNLELQNNAAFDANSLVTADRNKVTALLSSKLPYSTIEVCAFFDASRNSSALVCFGNSITDVRLFSIMPTTIQARSGQYVLNIDTSPKSTWSATYDSSSIPSYYVNGGLKTGTLTSNVWSVRSGNFGLSGANNYNQYNFVGNYYNVRVYNRALSAAEIAANYAIDKRRFNLP